jgi:hypothetical protein
LLKCSVCVYNGCWSVLIGWLRFSFLSSSLHGRVHYMIAHCFLSIIGAALHLYASHSSFLLP